MNYQLHYDVLISNAIRRGWNKKSAPVYIEKHHIIPRSIGGSNNKSNLVVLTAREHFIAHLLLAKIYGGKMWHAAHMMSNMGRYSNRKYENIRKEHARQVSETQKGRHAPKGEDSCSYGLKRSVETRAKISKARTGVSNGIHSDDTKKKMRDSRKRQTKTSNKKVSISGIEYNSITSAAISLGITTSYLCQKIKNNKFPDCYYL